MSRPYDGPGSSGQPEGFQRPPGAEQTPVQQFEKHSKKSREDLSMHWPHRRCRVA